MWTAAVFAALAGWWAAGPPPRAVLDRPPTLEARSASALPLRLRLGLGLVLALVAIQVAPGPWWARFAVAAVIAGAACWGLGLITPDTSDAEAERRAQVPEALTLLACGVEAGLPLGAAVAAVADSTPGVVGHDLRRVRSGLTIGLAEREAWSVLSERDVWRRAATDIGRVATSGAAVAPVLRRYEELLERARHESRLEKARTAGVKSVFPLMACFLPAFILVGVVPTVGGVVVRFFG